MHKKTSTENKKIIIKVILNQSKYRGNVATNYNKKTPDTSSTRSSLL